MKIRALASLAACTLLLAFFQNCSPVKTTSQQAAQTSSRGNGDPYYGKPYDHGSGCVGQDPVRSRVMYIDASTAFLAKENCQILNPPRPLAPGEAQLDGADPSLLYYNGLTYATSNPPSLVQKVERSMGSTSSMTATLPSPSTAGNLFVCFVLYGDSGARAVSVTDSAGNSFIRSAGAAPAPINMQVEAWYAQNISAGSNPTLTVNFSAPTANTTILVCQEFSGIRATGALDSVAVVSGSTPTASIGPITTSSVGDLIVAGAWHVSTDPTPGPGYSLISNFSSDIYFYGTSGNPGSYLATANGMGSNWLGIALAFKTK